MNSTTSTPRVLVLCTAATGLDAVAEVLRHGFLIRAIVGVLPSKADPIVISGWTDVQVFAQRWGIPHIYVERYDLKSEADRKALETLDFDLIWVTGWQRLIPSWLIDQAGLGALGVHGSPDGIHGGRGRSPQNWAIMLGCRQFDLALFRITPGMDDGPIVAQRSFFYKDVDDIAISYKKAALCMGEMMIEVLRNPALLEQAQPQHGEAFYYPQRRPEDGYADWTLPCRDIWAHCRALARPYPGLRTRTQQGQEIVIWQCQPFDDRVDAAAGTISFVFEDGAFLVTCADGRVLVSDYTVSDATAALRPKQLLLSQDFTLTMHKIIEDHTARHPDKPLAQRIRAKVRV
jgi:methionyl-tRNA formyltransferase